MNCFLEQFSSCTLTPTVKFWSRSRKISQMPVRNGSHTDPATVTEAKTPIQLISSQRETQAKKQQSLRWKQRIPLVAQIWPKLSQIELCLELRWISFFSPQPQVLLSLMWTIRTYPYNLLQRRANAKCRT